MKRNSQQGVALVITLILLSVITFMAVTFLVVSRREGEQVNTLSQQSNAKYAAAAAVDRAQAQIMAQMIASNNPYNFSLLVSTNYINPYFAPGGIRDAITNVGYFYLNTTNLLTGRDMWQNLANLQILPRPPVFISSNRFQVHPDFRYYLDLNRNGRFDTNGIVADLDNNGNQVFTNGNTRVLNQVVGDPEWIGILDRPDLRHSSSNLFVGRYAFLAQPIGNSLDLNFMHNQAKLAALTQGDGYLRNQGVGSWEINLAGFLNALNPSTIYGWGNYDYVTNQAAGSSGTSFADAAELLYYRHTDTFGNKRPGMARLYGNAAAFYVHDYTDVYSSGSLMTTLLPAIINPNGTYIRIPTWPWSGADNLQQFYGPQDLFNIGSLLGPANSFSNHLYSAGTNLSTFDRYTFYRLLEQMGFESAPEPSPYPYTPKLNLNAVNVGGTNATNFIAWTPVQFFTNAADRLLKSRPEFSFYGVSITNIPIYPTNFYSPALHRLLQLAANIYDASTNKTLSPSGFDYPSVFRPTFNRKGTNIFINGYVEEQPANQSWRTIPLSLPQDLALAGPNTVNIYSIPWVVGVKKGFPNFNEFAMQSISQITRKMELVRPAVSAPRPQWHTNIQYTVGLSNVLGAEAWNSYTNPISRPVHLILADNLVMVLTNEFGQVLLRTNITVGTNWIYSTNVWPGSANLGNQRLTSASFQVPLYTNLVFLPDSIYHQQPPSLIINTNPNAVTPFETTVGFPLPHFVLSVTNRLRFIMLDSASGRVIDYVQFDGMNTIRDLTAELSTTNNNPFANNTLSQSIWNPTRTGGLNSPYQGLIYQLNVSSGAYPVGLTDWNNAQMQQTANVQTKQAEISQFNLFYNNGGGITNLAMQAPFSPTRKVSQYFSWQANDPLVHYTLGDITSFPQTNQLDSWVPAYASTNLVLPNIGVLNDRYSPWGGNNRTGGAGDTNAFNLAVKDPLVTRSDDWQFPTNKYPNIGWLGRVHRGTPWQTIYLKSSPVNSNSWQAWTGNALTNDAIITQPTNDWKILDLFTAAPNENASRGQLSVNQPDFAAWAAILDGVIVITNTSSTSYAPFFIDPANTNNLIRPDGTTIPNTVQYIVSAINDVRRTNYVGGVFTSVGDILATPQLTVSSPYLNLTGSATNILSDAAYERIPQQILSLLRVGTPRYVIYAYGQSLKPAEHSIVQTSGPFFGICTNYQITGEVVTRTVVRFENSTNQASLPNRAVIESFSVLPPE